MKLNQYVRDLARNPLGIIALFISLIYGFATLLLNLAADTLTNGQRWPLIIFIIIFPVLVLWKGVSPIIYNYFSPVPAAGEAFVAGVFVLARDKGSMAGNLVACVLLS